MNAKYSYLTQVAKSASLLDKDRYSAICCPDFRFKFVGVSLCKQMGGRSEDILDKRLDEIDSPLNHLYLRYREVSEEILNGYGRKEIEYVTVVPQENEMSFFQSKVSPIVYDEKKVGLYIKTEKVNPVKVISLLKTMPIVRDGRAQMIVVNNDENVLLSEREEFILFMMLLGKFDKEIAHFLSIVSEIELTKTAITKIITRNLYQKFNVASRSELIMRAVSDGFLDKFPKLLTPPKLLKVSQFL